MTVVVVRAWTIRWWRPPPESRWGRPPSSTSFPVTDLGVRRNPSLRSSSASFRGPAMMVRPWEEDLERVLWTEAEITARVSELATEISEDIRGSDVELVVVGVAIGGFVFLADLVRGLGLSVAVDLIRVESYDFRMESSGAPVIVSDIKVDVKGKHVILVEDIVDTGNSLSFLISHMKLKGACAVSVCTFLDKPGRRTVHFELVGDGKFYRGFECPDYFVVGYGMDFSESYRNLPFIAVLRQEKYTL